MLSRVVIMSHKTTCALLSEKKQTKTKNQSSPTEHHSRLCSIVTSDFGWVMSALSSMLVSPACRNWAGDFFFPEGGARCKKRARSEKKHPPGFCLSVEEVFWEFETKGPKKRCELSAIKYKSFVRRWRTVTWLQQNVEEVEVMVSSIVPQSWDYPSPWTTASPETLL